MNDAMQPIVRSVEGRVELVRWSREDGASAPVAVTDPVRMAAELLNAHHEAQAYASAHVAAYAAETLSTPVFPAILGD